MLVYIIRAKANKSKKGLRGQVYCHGGGGIVTEALNENHLLCRIASICDVVIFNVEYRLAPEAKVPEGSKDCVEAIKYFHENADTYGVDPERFSVAGFSGGALIAFGAALLLARENSKILKLLFLIAPMTGHLFYTTPQNTVAQWEKDNWMIAKCGFELLATDLEDQRDNDPLLNPLCITHEEAKTLPGVVL